MIVETFISH